MSILICENNLVGFLSAVYHCYYTYYDVSKITSDKNQSMLDRTYNIESSVKYANKVKKGIIDKVNYNGYKNIADAYLSCNKDKEQILFRYLKLLFLQGRVVNSMYDNRIVIDFYDMLKKVRHEVHRMHGFIRFQEMSNGIFYSYFSSDNDIIELLIPHFRSRFNQQQFVLHDVKRAKIVYYDGAIINKILAPKEINIELSARERFISDLWKQYHTNVNIEERKNKRLQRQFAPIKYRWFMNEF